MQWEQIKIPNMILHNIVLQRNQALRRFKRNYNFIPGPFWCKHIGRTGMWKRWEWPKLQKSRLKYNFHNKKYLRHPCQLPQHRLLHPFVHFLHLLLLYSWLILFCFLQFQDHSYNPVGIKSLFKWFTILFFLSKSMIMWLLFSQMTCFPIWGNFLSASKLKLLKT